MTAGPGPGASPLRCFGDGDEGYQRYHDAEWGRPVAVGPDERELLERLSLEAFQSGLSWLTILRKREGFRAAFADFAPAVVAQYDETDVARLLSDDRIVRNRAKVAATITNARALVAMHERGERLQDLLERFRPPARPAPPQTLSQVPASTPESAALAKELKRHGFVFVGPTTAYATMQAIGLVDDHVAGCVVRDPAGAVI